MRKPAFLFAGVIVPCQQEGTDQLVHSQDLIGALVVSCFLIVLLFV